MSCMYGNCNDANCVDGQTSDVQGNPCDDADCAPCGSVAVLAGPPMTTVLPNPSIPNSWTTVAPSTNYTQMAGVLGQWGATIAGIVSGTPVSSTPTGFRTGVAAAPPLSFGTSSAGGSTILILLLVVVVVIMVGSRK